MDFIQQKGASMASYIIYHYNITDRSQIEQLTQLSMPVNDKYGAKVIVGSPVKTLEGETFSHIVILEFDDFDSAKEYYYSSEHQEISVLRNKVTSGWATIVPGETETQRVVDSGYFDARS